MTITKEQLDELERVARSMPQPERWNIYVKAAALARLVAIARAALVWNEARKRIAPARESVDDLGTRTARVAMYDAIDDLDHCETALDAALRGAP